MARCVLHPGRESATSIFNRNYCAVCRDGIVSARGRVNTHVEPVLWVLILLSALAPKTDNPFVLGFESHLGLRSPFVSRPALRGVRSGPPPVPPAVRIAPRLGTYRPRSEGPSGTSRQTHSGNL